MTCREFKHSAAALTLWELSRAHSHSHSHSKDEPILTHADECEACGTWLRKQRSLAASMRTLQAQSAGLEAGPHVERTLLQEFRRTAAARALVPAAMPRHFESNQPNAVSFTPIAMRLSRFFEIGAYAAVAAAMVVGLFLGVQLLQHRSRTMPAQVASAPASVAPVVQKPLAVEPREVVKRSGSSTGERPVQARGRVQRQPSPAANDAAGAAQSGIAEASQTIAEEGYVPLMFCDPLSCSSDLQVVRMELPSPAGQDAQPQIADVVVGYDGVVRAMRIVN